MAPETCTVSGLPSDAHRHILPRASTVVPAAPDALVSRETSLKGCSSEHVFLHKWGHRGKGRGN